MNCVAKLSFRNCSIVSVALAVAAEVVVVVVGGFGDGGWALLLLLSGGERVCALCE